MAPEHSAAQPVLRARRLGVEAGPDVLLRDVELTVAPGEIVVIIGATGSGKTTLLDALSGMSPHRIHGGLEVLGEDGLQPATLRRLRSRDLGVLQQDIRGWYTPYRCVEAQILEGWTGDQAAGRARVEALLGRFALPIERIRSRFPNQLSDGMLRRAALCGLLARSPSLVIADEPTAGLDGPTRWRAWELLLDCGAAVVTATHDVDLVAALVAQGRRLHTVQVSEGTLEDAGEDQEE